MSSINPINQCWIPYMLEFFFWSCPRYELGHPNSFQFFLHVGNYLCCHNPSLGLTTKARAWKVARQEGSLKVTLHAPGSVGKCEGMNLHTSEGASTLGIGLPMDSWIFIEWLQGSKLNGLKSSLYHWEFLGIYMSKMVLDDPFRHFKHKLWPKEGSGVKLPIWLPTTKSQESPRFPRF
jgi:hypothetical protein